MNHQHALPADDAPGPARPSTHLPDDPVEAISGTMSSLSQAAEQMRLAMTEVLAVTTFCRAVQGTTLSMSLITDDMDLPAAGIDQLAEQLHRDACHGLAALRRTGRLTLAAIDGLEQAGAMLRDLAARLDAQQAQAPSAAPR